MKTDNTTPTRAIAHCHWHNGLSDTARLVQTGEAGRLFACAGCRLKYRLTPVADQA